MAAGHEVRERIAHAATPWEWQAPSVVVWSVLIAGYTVAALVDMVVTPGHIVAAGLWTLVVALPWTRSVRRWRRLHPTQAPRPQPHT